VVEQDQFLTIEEAIEYTGRSRTTLLRRVAEKRLTKYVRGLRRRIYFDRSELDNMMTELDSIRPDEEEE